MRLDNYCEAEQRRINEERESDRTTRRPSVLMPGTLGGNTPEAERARFVRHHDLMNLEREISARRIHVQQLQLCSRDLSGDAGAAYGRAYEAANAELQAMEARANELARDSPTLGS